MISIIVWFAGALPASNSAKPKGAGMWGLDSVRLCGGKALINRLRPEELVRCAAVLERVGVAEVEEIQNQIITWLVYLDCLCLLMFAGLVGTLGLWVVSSSFRYAHALYKSFVLWDA